MSTTYPPETSNGVVTSWIPLSTGWIDQPFCSTRYFARETTTFSTRSYTSGDSIVQVLEIETKTSFFVFDPDYEIFVMPQFPCLPSEVTISASQGRLDIPNSDANGSTSMSLLPLKCPDMWSTVATFIRSSISTQVMCCPSNYFVLNSGVFSTGVEGACLSTIDKGMMLVYANEKDYRGVLTKFKTLSNTLNPDSRSSWTTLASGITVQAASIIGWNVRPSPSSTSSPITDQIKSDIWTPFTTQTPSSLSTSGDGLSSCAKAGIGVSAGLGVLLIIALIVWAVLLQRRNKKLSAKIGTKEESRTQSHGIDSNGVFNSSRLCELSASQTNKLGHESLPEIDGSQINELGRRSLCELDPISIPVELPVVTPTASDVR